MEHRVDDRTRTEEGHDLEELDLDLGELSPLFGKKPHHADHLASRLERELARTGILQSQWRPGQEPPDTPLGGFHLVLLDLDSEWDQQDASPDAG